MYYPSINYKEFKKYNDIYFKKFKSYPNEITILTYDALGLIYYAWKENGNINSINDFSFKNKIKGKIGTFSFKDKKVLQDLEIYKVDKDRSLNSDPFFQFSKCNKSVINFHFLYFGNSPKVFV